MKNLTLPDRAIKIFLSEVIFQSDIVLHSAKHLDIAIKKNDKAIKTQATDKLNLYNLEIWMNLQSLIGAAARISAIIFPAGLPKAPSKIDKWRQQRGVAMRRVLDLKRNTPYQNKRLRNHLEHFDERIDVWAQHSRARSYVSRMLGSLEFIRGLPSQDVMRQYDPSKNVASFQGEEFNIKQLVESVTEVKGQAQCALEP